MSEVVALNYPVCSYLIHNKRYVEARRVFLELLSAQPDHAATKLVGQTLKELRVFDDVVKDSPDFRELKRAGYIQPTNELFTNIQARLNSVTPHKSF